MKKIAIAIDGPAAAGKSTIAKKVAQILNYTYIDTGAMYRCVAYYLLSQKQDLDDESKIASKLENIHIELLPQGQVLLNGTDVSEQIRQDEVSKNASKVAAYQAVRAYLVDLQRKMATKGGVILDGRDIGSVVLPKAELKIYQVASVETRAKRRYEENQKRGIISSLEQIKQDIELLKEAVKILHLNHFIKIMDLESVLDELYQSTMLELDFEKEKENNSQL